MKKDIREEVLKRRNLLSKEEISKNSDKIRERLLGLSEYQNSKNIMFYVSFGSEVETHDMVKEAIKDKIVIVPKVADNEIKPALITDFESLIPCGKFDILEPFDALIFDVKTINMVIVAGLAFDKKGNRIGYGYGYYDKFLKSVPKSLKIGLCYDSQIVEEIDSDEFDIPVDMIITEKGVIDCRG